MKVKNLQLSSLQSHSMEESSYPHQNDILFRTEQNDQKKESSLKGHVNILSVTTGGLRQQWKPRWAVQDPGGCKLRFFKTELEEEVVGEVNIMGATFVYDAGDVNGQFKICTTDEEQSIDVGTAENRLYWLQQLQKARREFTQNVSTHHNLAARSSVGLLKEKAPDESSKESSPFKEIFATME